MAIYSFSAKVVSRSAPVGSRSKQYSATAAAAYRSGECIRDERTGQVFDYTARGGVWHKEIIAPGSAPAWMSDRAALWNGVEAGERRNDAQLARGIMGALPHELSHQQRLELVRGFIHDEITPRGMVADFAIHAPDRAGDERNWHCHILLTMRRVEGDNFAAKKERAWNSKELIEEWRAAWAEHCNDALADAGFDDVKIDHRSHATRGIEQEPGIHLGQATSAYERSGHSTARGGRLREIREDNAELDRLVDELAAIDRQIADAEERRLATRSGEARPELTPETERDLAARFGDTPQTAPEASPEDSWQAQKREARDAIRGAEPFAQQIRKTGETQHQGLGSLPWWQRTIEYGRGLFQQARGWVENTWSGFIERRRDNERDRDGQGREQ